MVIQEAYPSLRTLCPAQWPHQITTLPPTLPVPRLHPALPVSESSLLLNPQAASRDQQAPIDGTPEDNEDEDAGWSFFNLLFSGFYWFYFLMSASLLSVFVPDSSA